MSRPKTMSVEHIEGGTFVGGDEDAYHFEAREGGPFSVMRDEDIGGMIAEIDGWRAVAERLAQRLRSIPETGSTRFPDARDRAALEEYDSLTKETT